MSPTSPEAVAKAVEKNEFRNLICFRKEEINLNSTLHHLNLQRKRNLDKHLKDQLRFSRHHAHHLMEPASKVARAEMLNATASCRRLHEIAKSDNESAILSEKVKGFCESKVKRKTSDTIWWPKSDTSIIVRDLRPRPKLGEIGKSRSFNGFARIRDSLDGTWKPRRHSYEALFLVNKDGSEGGEKRSVTSLPKFNEIVKTRNYTEDEKQTLKTTRSNSCGNKLPVNNDPPGTFWLTTEGMLCQSNTR